MLSAKSILYPMLAMVLLTAIVSIVMYRRRVAEMRARRIPPQEVASAAAMAARLDDTGAADNFRNLFETPVLFYAAVLTIYATRITDPPYVALAWLYVAARVVHTVIHATSNVVLNRLKAFLLSWFVIWIMWGLIAWDLIVVGKS